MDTIKYGYDGLTLLADLTWDRLLFPGMIVAALFTSAYLVSL